MITLTPVTTISVALSSPHYGELTFGAADEAISLFLAPFGIGPPGPEGPQGPVGPMGGYYEHVQASASSEWIVNHNLGYNPVIEVLSPGGLTVVVEIQHMTTNQARVYFLTPQTGKAIVR